MVLVKGVKKTLQTKADWQARDRENYDTVLREYVNMNEDTKKALDFWIETYIKPAKNVNESDDSYVLKRRFESTIGIGDYVTHEQFKGAMLAKGYVPRGSCELNWCFRIRKVKIDPSKLSRRWGWGDRWEL